MTANDCYRPSVDAQLRYTVQWFHEWSEMQRDDFLPILTQKFAPASYVNGLISGMDSLGCGQGRPPSLFQCRVKLFREWVDGWSQAEREQLLSHIKSMDPAFHARVQEELGAPNGDIKHNGESPTKDHQESPVKADSEDVPSEPDVVSPVVNSNSVGHDDEVQAEPEAELVESEAVEPDDADEVEVSEECSPDVE